MRRAAMAPWHVGGDESGNVHGLLGSLGDVGNGLGRADMASSLPLFFLIALGSRCNGVSTASSGRRRRRISRKSPPAWAVRPASCAALSAAGLVTWPSPSANSRGVSAGRLTSNSITGAFWRGSSRPALTRPSANSGDLVAMFLGFCWATCASRVASCSRARRAGVGAHRARLRRTWSCPVVRDERSGQPLPLTRKHRRMG